MHLFPEEWELLWLFESEPTVLDNGVPWQYNTLTFETRRGDEYLKCEIDPKCEIVRLYWSRKGVELLTLDLIFVRGLRVETGKGRDMLIAYFREPYLGHLELQMKPTISLRWRMDRGQI